MQRCDDLIASKQQKSVLPIDFVHTASTTTASTTTTDLTVLNLNIHNSTILIAY